MTEKKPFKDRVLTAIKAGKTSTHDILSYLREENTDGSRARVRSALRALEKDGTAKLKKDKGEIMVSES